MTGKPHVLIIEAVFYEDIATALREGAEIALNAVGADIDHVTVPGVLEVPGALAMAIAAADAGGPHYDGYVALGCVIRGETTHYDIVANESARALMDLAIEHKVAVGNGILTVENEAQAWARARPSEKDKGGDAARAALFMIAVRHRFLGEEA